MYLFGTFELLTPGLNAVRVDASAAFRFILGSFALAFFVEIGSREELSLQGMCLRRRRNCVFSHSRLESGPLV